MIYRVEVSEYLSKIIEVDADSIDDAISSVIQMYREKLIILDANDFISTEITEFIPS